MTRRHTQWSARQISSPALVYIVATYSWSCIHIEWAFDRTLQLQSVCTVSVATFPRWTSSPILLGAIPLFLYQIMMLIIEVASAILATNIAFRKQWTIFFRDDLNFCCYFPRSNWQASSNGLPSSSFILLTPGVWHVPWTLFHLHWKCSWWGSMHVLCSSLLLFFETV